MCAVLLVDRGGSDSAGLVLPPRSGFGLRLLLPYVPAQSVGGCAGGVDGDAARGCAEGASSAVEEPLAVQRCHRADILFVSRRGCAVLGVIVVSRR